MFQAARIIFISILTSLSNIVYSQVATDSIKFDTKIFELVEVEANYPGGETAWRKFLEKNLNPDVGVKNGAPAGRYTVWVQFVVSKDGTTSEIKALTNLGYGMEKEVIRIIKNSGQWSPAWQNGRTVKAYRKQPVTFIIEHESINIESKVLFTLFTDSDNEISVTVNKIKNEDIMVTISQGRIISKGDRKYIVKVTKPGRVIISVFNSKKNKKVGDINFEVREGE